MTHRRRGVTDLKAYICKRSVADGDCWLWTGPTSKYGYGVCSVAGINYAHRVAYTAWLGQIPTGMTIHHTCYRTGCVNPEHLTLLTHSENVIDGLRHRADPDVCVRGHLRSVEGRTNAKGHRVCLACKREHMRRVRRDQRLADSEVIGS